MIINDAAPWTGEPLYILSCQQKVHLRLRVLTSIFKMTLNGYSTNFQFIIYFFAPCDWLAVNITKQMPPNFYHLDTTSTGNELFSLTTAVYGSVFYILIRVWVLRSSKTGRINFSGFAMQKRVKKLKNNKKWSKIRCKVCFRGLFPNADWHQHTGLAPSKMQYDHKTETENVFLPVF